MKPAVVALGSMILLLWAAPAASRSAAESDRWRALGTTMRSGSLQLLIAAL